MLIIIIASMVVCSQGFLTSPHKTNFLLSFGNKLLYQKSKSKSSIKMVGTLESNKGPIVWLKTTLESIFPTNLILSELKNVSKKQDDMSSDLKVVKTNQDVISVRQDDISADLKVIKTNQDVMSHQIVGLEESVDYLIKDRGPTIELLWIGSMNVYQIGHQVTSLWIQFYTSALLI